MARAIVEQLRKSLRKIGRPEEAQSDIPGISLGIPAIDQILPQGGVPPGSLVEWLSEPGMGAEMLAAAGLPALLPESRIWCIVNTTGTFYPASVAARIRPDQMLVVHHSEEAGSAWAIEQILQCPAVALTWVWVDRVSELVLRRWQLAAARGGGVAMLFRSSRWGRQTAWSDVRFQVTAVPARGGLTQRRWRVELLYCRGGFPGRVIELEQRDEAGLVRVASRVVHSAAGAASA